MTTHRPEGESVQPEERGLVVRSEENSLDSLSRSPYLVEAGFSPRFPQILMRLNDVLPHQSIRRLSLELHPGKTSRIDAHVEYGGAYRFFVDSIPANKSVEITLVGRGRYFRIEDIKDFARTIFPDKPAILHADSSPHLIEPRDHFNEDLQTVTEETLRTWLEELPAHESSGTSFGGKFFDYPYSLHEAEVRIGGQKCALFRFKLLEGANTVIGCGIESSLDGMIPAFYHSGRPEDAERVMEELAKLFDKPYLYPYRGEDLPKVNDESVK